MTRHVFVAAASLILGASVASAQPTFNEVVYGTEPVNGGTLALTMDIYTATSGSGPRPVMLWIHGGAWFGGTHNQVLSDVLALRAQGITVVSVAYRLSGQAIFPAQIEDVKGAVRFLRANAGTYNVDPARIGAWGSSAGGHLAALLATSGGVAELEGDSGGNLAFSSAIQLAVDYFGPTDIINMELDITTPPGSTVDHDAPDSGESRLIGFDQPGQGVGVLRANLNNPLPPFPEKVALANQVNPITHITSNDPPIYIAHGDSDTTVPSFQSVRLKNAMDAAGVPATLRIVPGAGHGNLGTETSTQATAFILSTFGSAGCVAPQVTRQPVSTRTCPVGTSVFAATIGGSAATFQWQWKPAGQVQWRSVNEGETRNLITGLPMFNASGTRSDRLSITSITNISQNASISRRDLRVVATNSCGTVESAAVFWAICPSDYNCDEGTDGDDVIAFMADWDQSLPAADFTGDDSVDGDDVIAFFARWDVGC